MSKGLNVNKTWKEVEHFVKKKKNCFDLCHVLSELNPYTNFVKHAYIYFADVTSNAVHCCILAQISICKHHKNSTSYKNINTKIAPVLLTSLKALSMNRFSIVLTKCKSFFAIANVVSGFSYTAMQEV